MGHYEVMQPIYKATTAVVSEVSTAQFRNPEMRFVFLYKPSSATEYGQLGFIHHEAPIPEGWELVTAEPIPGDRTREQLRTWFDRFIGKLPLLPYGR